MTHENTDVLTPTEPEAVSRRADALVELSLSPVVAAAATAREFSSIEGANLAKFVAVVSEAVESATSSNLHLTEVTLSAQAIALDVIFNECAQRAANAVAVDVGRAETLLRLALKAQSQCRTTLLTLAEIKNPRPIAFVNQANFANGPQQVNNRPLVAATAGRDSVENNSNEMNSRTDEEGNLLANPENPTDAELTEHGRKSGWTDERRARQSALARAQKPWLHASGPRTELGKAISASNARKRFAPGRLGNHLPDGG